jgi:hypothetical protein
MLTYDGMIYVVMSSNLSQSAEAQGFANDIGVDIYQGLQGMGRLAARLVALDMHGATAHITDETGTDYYSARVDYTQKDELKASRAIAVIMAGYHTKFAYWPDDAEPKKILVHAGEGHLIVGDPANDELDGSFNTAYFKVSADVTPFIVLQPGRFYTLEAASWSTLVVSALSEIGENGGWGSMEIPVQPGRESIRTPQGVVPVPTEFVTADFS